ncbi:probable JmjC domain-containing histone demethylation protein 2C isoform X3 [Cimex lectularius]|uniref:[histone H3]-dimethyl-L-lysine(9) demethylase n=1 Tax=Cimex lectularius TaxID=79782 RepID=A0A8I6R8W4_CIMLE|nr:probable JmjC domain-containing histone demethylation protein 2C isoform X3 [Cimex lectularius]
MAYKIREELVGKRFLSVSAYKNNVKLGKISDWCWKAGVIRAATHKDNTNKDLQVLVEYDDREWQRREWVAVHKPGVFHAFLVEKTLVWCSKSDSARSPCSNLAPALTFSAILGGAELSCCKIEPVEFLKERTIAFRDPATFRPAQDFIRKWSDDPAVQEWTRAQDGQGIILATPSVLVGYRVQVYRSEGTTQWYTAVIVGYNEATRELTVTDDTVLEDHNEDPCLVQMRLIGDGVVESIMKGEDVGMTPRRSRSNFMLHHRTIPRGKKPAKISRKSVERKSAVSRVPRATKPPSQPPDRGKRSTRLLKDYSKLGKSTSQPSSDKEDKEDRGRTLRSLRSNSISRDHLQEKRIKVRPVPKVKKKESPKKEEKKKRPEPLKEEEQPKEEAVSKEEPAEGEEKKQEDEGEDDEEEEEQVKLEVEVSDVCNREEEVVEETKAEREEKEETQEERRQETAEGSPCIDDDDGPLPASSPFRMEDTVGGGLLRDDRSDSGVSSLRSAGSGDERSGSRSSALSTTPPPTQRKVSEQVWREGGMSQPPQGYPGGGPPGILIPPPPLYSPLPPELWAVKRYPSLPATSTHLAPPSEDSERAYHQHERGRLMRERQREQEVRELEKQKEKERAEAKERQERDRLEKQRAAEQAVHKHFEESLRLAQSKRNNMGWINSLPGPPGSRSEEERKQHAQQQQAHAAAAAIVHDQQTRILAERIRQQEVRDRAYYQQQASSTPARVSISNKVDYPPQSHRAMKQMQAEKQQQQQQQHTALPKAEPNFNFFNLPRYQPMSYLHHEKSKDLKVQAVEIPNPPPLMSDLKSSVIVKNDKSPGLDKIHSPSPKLRTDYLPTSKSPFEYRSPSQSPHPLSQTSPSPHFDGQNLASISKVHMHRTQLLSPHPQQRQSPHQQRQSPHTQHRQSPHPQHRQSPHHPPSPHLHPHPSPPAMVTTYSKSATVSSYPYPAAAVHYAPPTTPPKTMVNTPTVCYKPSRPTRNDIVSKPLTPSPYQQLSQHNLPPPHQTAQGSGLPPPPAAHATKTFSGQGIISITQVTPTSPQQLQPLDLGVKEEPQSPKRKAEEIPEEVDLKKVKTEEEPVLARVSEASPLLATAATTITTVLNTSLQQDRPQTPTKPTEPEKSNSPRPSYPVHKLKKAWLQRHSGEDTTENSSDVKCSGTCVTLPMPVPPSVPVKKSEGVVNSIHSIGSMAVNSISLGKKPKVNRKGPKELNGHINVKTPEGDDSSSSDPERKSTPQKRVPPKVKRKKGVRKTVPEEAKRKKTSVSSTDSDKESGSDKESDSNSTGSKKKEEKTKEGGKKRGRRPKSTPSKNGNEEESRKKIKEEDRTTPQRDPIQKPSVGQLKKTGESFLQDGPCFEVAPKLAKCRECRWTPNQRNRNMPNIFCRFYAFRRLRYTKNGQLAIAGFSDPHRDALQDDLKLWLPSEGTSPPGLDVDMSKFLLAQVGDQFCDLLQQEKEAVSVHMSEDKTIAWKRVVQGVREMCDVCETTLFNFHWACVKCGFVVCIDCYKGRKNGTIKAWGDTGRDRDEMSWLLCTNRQGHEQEKLMLTQIIAGDSLNQLGQKIHGIRQTWGQQCHCECFGISNGVSKEVFKNALSKKKELNGDSGREKKENKSDDNSSTLSWLADVALSEDKKKTSEEKEENEFTSDDDKDSNYSTLRELLIRPSGKSNGSRAPSPAKSQLETLDQVISTVIEHQVAKDEARGELKHFVRKFRRIGGPNGVTVDPSLHVRIMTMTESKSLYPDVPHSWLCGGTLLRLLDSTNPKNYVAFQDQWKRGQPILISDVTKHLDSDLWTPESFARDFGETRNDLINCINGNTVPNQPMRKFWDGFESVSKRLKDERNNPMILKLKDWPPGEDFAEMLPSRFNDLMKVLPMAEYTNRTGRLNLASRLPECFVRPDLGPKMYTAYGSATHPTAGTTNLHLDISDAVNVMVYVGIPTDVDQEQCCKDVYRAIDEAGCDLLTRRRVREKGQLPGALWHIYLARDSDKIRDLLNKVALEKGARPEPHHDPIHDQSWYLDTSLRERLYKEYGVEGYSIVQCLGDAVFVPAGAPHQVRNLHNCIKVAEDFVSPENVSHCFHLTQEFRDLSDTHTNHEDKLQIKNIMYHAVKDSLAVLECTDSSGPTANMKKEENGDS